MGKAKCLSEVTGFDLEAFRCIAGALEPTGDSRPDAAELLGGLLAAAVTVSEGLEASPLDEFSRACDGMCVSNPFREAGFSTLHTASRWLSLSLQPNALDAHFAAACKIAPEVMCLHAQVWQD